jgi:hypothetical protein
MLLDPSQFVLFRMSTSNPNTCSTALLMSGIAVFCLCVFIDWKFDGQHELHCVYKCNVKKELGHLFDQARMVLKFDPLLFCIPRYSHCPAFLKGADNLLYIWLWPKPVICTSCSCFPPQLSKSQYIFQLSSVNA